MLRERERENFSSVVMKYLPIDRTGKARADGECHEPSGRVDSFTLHPYSTARMGTKGRSSSKFLAHITLEQNLPRAIPPDTIVGKRFLPNQTTSRVHSVIRYSTPLSSPRPVWCLSAAWLALQGGAVISPDQGLFDAGFDSISAEEFVARLQERLISDGWVSDERDIDEAVSSTTVFDCPTPRHIAEHVEGILTVAGESAGRSRGADAADPVATSSLQ